MTEKERMLAGKIYCPFKVGDNSRIAAGAVVLE